MVTIPWNSLGFRVLDALPKGTTFDAEYCPDNSLTALDSLHPEGVGRKHVIHEDDARAHTD
jgi:hypothetical protein